MNPLTLYLLRHGESTANVGQVFAARKIDPPLSGMGVEQISRQADSLKRVRFDAVYTSPLLRARQSVEIIARELGLEFEETSHLLEVDVGMLDGQSETDPHNWAIYEKTIKTWEMGLDENGFPGGESLINIRDRFVELMSEIEQRRIERVLLVGHCLLYMAVIWLFCENRGTTLEDGHMGRGHLSIVTRRDEKYRLHRFNLPPGEARSHLLI